MQRSCYWDNIKGLLMFLVVFAHVLFPFQDVSATVNTLVDVIYLFHMPAFVFVSGYFGKSERSRSFEGIVGLVFLYFIFNSLMGFYYGFTSLLKPMYSFWYLVALVVWRLTAHRIAEFRATRLILLVAAVFAGFYPSIDNTFAVARIIGFYPFYMAGYHLGNEESDEFIGKGYAKRLMIGLGVLAALVYLGGMACSFFRYQDSELQMDGYASPMSAFGRIALFILASLAIYALRCVSVEREIPFLTKWGRNSLCIFILHRPFAISLSDLMKGWPIQSVMTIAIGAAVVLCWLLGNNWVARCMNAFVVQGVGMLTGKMSGRFNFAKWAAIGVASWFVVSVIRGAYKDFDRGALSVGSAEVGGPGDIVYPGMSAERRAEFDAAFRITFAGDLILLEDQVKRGSKGAGYDFSDVFEQAEPYISSADFAIGVFEGPMAGREVGYSTSNFDDGKELRLNFPDEFAGAIKKAGFDLVTTANNHLLDKGESGALQTLDRLDAVGLDHVGSYRSAEEKAQKRVRIVERGGIRMAVLSYTYGSNYVDTDMLASGRLSYVTSVIGGTDGGRFESLKALVERDFAEARAANPDLIIVLPHLGTQFSNVPDEEQRVWFEIFKRNGADIVLGDHPHVVEPAVIEEYEGRPVFQAFCPGNFANIYRRHQGYASMLVDVYIDRTSKKVIGGGIVPLYTCAQADGNFRAIPIHRIMTDSVLRSQLTTDDVGFAEKANREITRVVFGHGMAAASMPERYYFDQGGFLRPKTRGLVLTKKMEEGVLLGALRRAGSVCFVGDSVTEGSKNGGCGWFEPIEEHLGGKRVFNFSKGGCTVSYMLNRASEIPSADLYVVALGVNDVRYRDERVCAMTSEAFIAQIIALKDRLLAKTSSAKFVFIAPWPSTDGDPFSRLSYADKTKLNGEYATALEKYCAGIGMPFINANAAIQAELESAPCGTYLLDHIHPNAAAGVLLYSRAVLSAR